MFRTMFISVYYTTSSRASPKRYACVRADDNGVKGINKSREDYFYHSVLLGKKEGKPDHHICPCDDEGEG